MQEKIYFENEKGLKLCGVLSNSTGDAQKPITILCHGFPSSKDSNTNLALEKALNEDGVSTLRFDFFGQGESEGNFEDITISECVEDIFSAVKYLKSLGYAKIALVGSSSGGGASIMAAAKLPDLFALVLKAPAVDHLEVEIAKRGEYGIEQCKEKGYAYHVRSNGEKFKINYSFFEDLKNNIGYDVADKISAPTLIVHGDADKDVPIVQSIKISTLIENCHLQIFHGADHRFSKSEDFEKMIHTIAEFIVGKAKK